MRRCKEWVAVHREENARLGASLRWLGLERVGSAVAQAHAFPLDPHPIATLESFQSIRPTSPAPHPIAPFALDVDDRPHAEGGHALRHHRVHHPHHGDMGGADLAPQHAVRDPRTHRVNHPQVGALGQQSIRGIEAHSVADLLQADPRPGFNYGKTSMF